MGGFKMNQEKKEQREIKFRAWDRVNEQMYQLTNTFKPMGKKLTIAQLLRKLPFYVEGNRNQTMFLKIDVRNTADEPLQYSAYYEAYNTELEITFNSIKAITLRNYRNGWHTSLQAALSYLLDMIENKND